jgi:hypothetical protein
VMSKSHMSLMSKFGRMQGLKAAEESHATYCSLVWFPLYPFRHPIHSISIEASNGMGFIHKSKLNTNGTFSVGKTWRLAELRAVQVVKVCCILFHCWYVAEEFWSYSRWLSISPCQEHIGGKLKIP